MGVYAKLQKVRNELSKSELKKTGKNKHMGFGYFELGDFLPKIIELCDKHGICTIIKFGEKLVTLKIVDVDKEDSIVVFTSPIHPAKLQGNAQPVQNLGATQTYMRRYLYMNAFEISENDIVDASDNKTTNTTQQSTTAQQSTTQQSTTGESKRVLSDAQVKRLYAIAKTSNKTPEDVKKWILVKWKKVSVNDLTKKEYDEICKALEVKPNTETKGETK